MAANTEEESSSSVHLLSSIFETGHLGSEFLNSYFLSHQATEKLVFLLTFYFLVVCLCVALCAGRGKVRVPCSPDTNIQVIVKLLSQMLNDPSGPMKGNPVREAFQNTQ